MKIDVTKGNKDILQSYIITTAKYDFSIHEKRILYKVIEVLQERLKGLKLKKDYSVEKDLFDNTWFTLPIKEFQKDSLDKNHRLIKEALTSLRRKGFEYEDPDHWGYYGIIEEPKIKKSKSHVTFKITPLLMSAFLNFSKGYRKFELETAMAFDSVYSMRFYELFSEKKKPITYSIDQIKKMFCIEGMYSENRDFFKRVINIAQNELNDKAPYSFKYDKIKTGKKITHLRFKPFYIEKNRDIRLAEKEAKKNTSIRWVFDKQLVNKLIDVFGFTHDGIKNNENIIKNAVSLPNFNEITSDIVKMIREYSIQNKPGFFISEIKKAIKLEDEKEINAEKVSRNIKEKAPKNQVTIFDTIQDLAKNKSNK